MENTIIDALNALVTKMGGNAKDNLMIIDALNDIIDNYSGGGSSGGGVVALRMTYDEQTQTITMDKTYNELLALCKNGAYVFFCMPLDGPSVEEANSLEIYILCALYTTRDASHPYNADFVSGQAYSKFYAASADENMIFDNN